jgi:NADH:ubiquinone oxidoreductase subunit 3 (subunit A)
MQILIGSASDSSPEGFPFESGRPHTRTHVKRVVFQTFLVNCFVVWVVEFCFCVKWVVGFEEGVVCMQLWHKVPRTPNL